MKENKDYCSYGIISIGRDMINFLEGDSSKEEFDQIYRDIADRANIMYSQFGFSDNQKEIFKKDFNELNGKDINEVIVEVSSLIRKLNDLENKE
tara:strand:- start:1573 stop:1854 length:282 start_codon:yes stop_codon:yes gene_type:complete